MRTTSWADVSARRLARSHLTDPRADLDPARIAADVLGIHAQVMSAAEMSIWLRQATTTQADVRAALWSHRTLVKTRGPRGTVHLLAADDLPMWTGAMSAVPETRISLPDDVRMTPDQVDRVVAAIDDAVAAVELTVDELTEAIVERAGPWAGDRVMDAFQDKWPRWRQMESIATNRGVLCFGPDRGRRTTYTSPRRWLPGFRPMPPDKALGRLIHRFLKAYGPATAAQFARWLGAPATWAVTAFGRQSDLVEVDFEGTPAFALDDEGETGASPLRLLPYFDAYVIGCFPRTTLFPGRAAERALSGGQAGTVPVLLVDGLVAGVWQRRRSGRKIEVTVEPFTDLTARQLDLVQAECARIGGALEGVATLTVGPVTVGAHA
jgi:hypothetical protein